MKSFKIKYDKKRAKKKLKAKFEKIIESDEWKEKATEYAINQIQGKTRTQKSAKDNSPLPKISEKHKDNKKRIAKYNGTGKNFGNTKSNLTITGQLLESLKREKHKTQAQIIAYGDRVPYKTKNGTVKKTPTNTELVKYLSDKGYKFIGLSEKMKKNIKKLVREEFFRKFKDL
tara:strand:+ start:1442 stop:1960 length:519 start_codon:yes stop_codon:yes gene_type:complete